MILAERNNSNWYKATTEKRLKIGCISIMIDYGLSPMYRVYWLSKVPNISLLVHVIIADKGNLEWKDLIGLCIDANRHLRANKPSYAQQMFIPSDTMWIGTEWRSWQFRPSVLKNSHEMDNGFFN